MKFAHIADCHIGSWREPRMREANILAFSMAIDRCIVEKVDFILIAGDLFNTSMPSIDGLKAVALELKRLKDNGIGAYIIAGSHDFSPSGKTMLDVLENAGLVVNAARYEEVGGMLKLGFATDKKTGAKITGMIGRYGSLEKNLYENLAREELEKEEGYKVFMFHSLITELKPKGLEMTQSQPMSILPKGFDYYAGGHPHIVTSTTMEGYGTIAYPGPTFPNNFREIEMLGWGGFYIVEDNIARRIELKAHDRKAIVLDCTGKGPDEAKEGLLAQIRDMSLDNMIVTVRLHGMLASGKPSEIGFEEASKILYEKGAYVVLKNSSALVSREFEEMKINPGTVEAVQEIIIDEHLGQKTVEGWDRATEKLVVQSLLALLSPGKKEGEKLYDFEDRIKKIVNSIVGFSEELDKYQVLSEE